MTGLAQHARVLAAADRDAQRYHCGNCGTPFATKAAKRAHKLSCSGSPTPAPMPDDLDDDSDAEGWQRWRMSHIITPEIKARADAEWEAMDERGNLPEGWEYQP